MFTHSKIPVRIERLSENQIKNNAATFYLNFALLFTPSEKSNMRNENLRKRIDNIQNKAKMLLGRIDSSDFEDIKKTILENRKQISENMKIIEEQKSIIDELKEIKEDKFEEFTSELLADMNYDTIFELTKNKEIAFDKNHPYINNIKFIKDLIDYYIQTEEYEECANLQSLVY